MPRSSFLTSWKEIADYLGKGVRTVQRWEHELGLPVRRPENVASKNTVMVDTEELERWMRYTFCRHETVRSHMDWELLEQSKRLIAESTIVREEHSFLVKVSRRLRLELENSRLGLETSPPLETDLELPLHEIGTLVPPRELPSNLSGAGAPAIDDTQP